MRSRIAHIFSYGLGLSMIVFSIGGNLLAQQAQVPEIDGGSIATGIGLLTAGVLMLRARRRSK